MISGKRFKKLQDEKKLVQWENIIADTYLTKVEDKKTDSVDCKVKVIMKRSVCKLCVCVCVSVCVSLTWGGGQEGRFKKMFIQYDLYRLHKPVKYQH